MERGPSRFGVARGFLRDALRTPDSGLVGQGLRFALAGGTVAIVYVGVTTLLSQVAGLDFQLALALGFGIALVVHFTLQRAFVWIHHGEYALTLHSQAGRYLLAATFQYGVTAGATSVLPGALGLPVEVVYLATVALMLFVNFAVFRYGIFHTRSSP
jgi:putative flippase GtrA